jgi:hypothetical protein
MPDQCISGTVRVVQPYTQQISGTVRVVLPTSPSIGVSGHLVIAAVAVALAGTVDLTSSFATTEITNDPKYLNKGVKRVPFWTCATCTILLAAVTSTAAGCTWCNGK